MPATSEDVLTIGEVAGLFGLQVWKLRKLINEGKIREGRRVGRVALFMTGEVPAIAEVLRRAGYVGSPEPAATIHVNGELLGEVISGEVTLPEAENLGPYPCTCGEKPGEPAGLAHLSSCPMFWDPERGQADPFPQWAKQLARGL